VQLELWNGARRDREARVLRHLESVLVSLPMDEEVWLRAWSLARRARSRGITVPAADIAIAACARRHGAEVESVDGDFERLAALHASEDA
jgi:predicted nucleic acid-binding protein